MIEGENVGLADGDFELVEEYHVADSSPYGFGISIKAGKVMQSSTSAGMVEPAVLHDS